MDNATNDVREFIFLIGIIIGVFFILKYALIYFRSSKSLNEYLRSFCEVAHSFLLWIVGIYGALALLESLLKGEGYFTLREVIIQLRNIFFVIFSAFLLQKWKRKCKGVFSKSALGKKTDKALFNTLDKLSSILLFIIAFLCVLNILGVPLGVFLTFGGVGGLAISWAAKDVISNFFGGLMIYINRPFTIGERIKSKNKDFEGVVEGIGWYMTRIRTLERFPTYIPNAIINESIIENPGRMYNRRIKSIIGLRYSDINRIKSIIEEVKEMLRLHPGIDHEQHLLVHFINFGPSSLDMEVYTFTKSINLEEFKDIQQDVLLKIADIISSNHAEIAFPTQTLYLQREEM